MRIVETDNFGGDYPDEKFVLGIMPEHAAKAIADVINEHQAGGDMASRHYIVVDNEYELKPGFEP